MRIPWKVKQLTSKLRGLAHFCAKNSIFRGLDSKQKTIAFACGFHGKSGGSQAIANIANLLSTSCNVIFTSVPTSHVNTLLNRAVSICRRLPVDSDLYICDLSVSIETLLSIKRQEKPVIVSIHGFKDRLHRLSQDHIEKVLSLVDKVHFVSPVQQRSYLLPVEKYFVIPNFCKPVVKTKATNNIGSVGNLDSPRKGAATTVAIGLASNAKEIHLWSTSKDNWNSSRVKRHDWESDKRKIFDSFDVLVFMSELETFGLVVIEAMSAGIPCVLSSLDVFEQFSNCPGIAVHSPNDINACVASTNQFLLQKDDLSNPMRLHFEENYSAKSVVSLWENEILKLLQTTGSP